MSCEEQTIHSIIKKLTEAMLQVRQNHFLAEVKTIKSC